MTKDDIIKLAQKAGFLIDTDAQPYQPNCILSTYWIIDENLERFAKLVAAAEREWVGLTDDEITEIYEMGLGVRASIETALDKLEERNNG